MYLIIDEDLQTIGLYDKLDEAKEAMMNMYNAKKGNYYQINEMEINVITNGDMKDICHVGEMK